MHSVDEGDSQLSEDLRASDSRAHITVPVAFERSRRVFHQRATFQAFAAGISSLEEIAPLLTSLRDDERLADVRGYFLAFRVRAKLLHDEGNNARDTPECDALGPEGGEETEVLEGQEDVSDDDEYCVSEHLLDLLRSESLEGILLVVALTDWGGIGRLGNEARIMAVQTSRLLLQDLGLVAPPRELQPRRQEGAIVPWTVPSVSSEFKMELPNKESMRMPSRLASARPAPIRHFPFDDIERPAEVPPARGRGAQMVGPNHFLASAPLHAQQGRRTATINEEELLHQQLFSRFTPSDAQVCQRVWEVNEKILTNLSRADILELRASQRPHRSVQKVLFAVGILQGAWPLQCPPNWSLCRTTVLASPTLRMELLLFNVSKTKTARVVKAHRLTKDLTLEEVRRISPPVGVLLEWVRAIVTAHAGLTGSNRSESRRETTADKRQFLQPKHAVLRSEGARMLKVAPKTLELNVEEPPSPRSPPRLPVPPASDADSVSVTASSLPSPMRSTGSDRVPQTQRGRQFPSRDRRPSIVPPIASFQGRDPRRPFPSVAASILAVDPPYVYRQTGGALYRQTGGALKDAEDAGDKEGGDRSPSGGEVVGEEKDDTATTRMLRSIVQHFSERRLHLEATMEGIKNDMREMTSEDRHAD